MACSRYRIENEGMQHLSGSYTVFSTGLAQPFYCAPGDSIIIKDVVTGSIVKNDPLYSGVIITLLGPCFIVDTPSTCTVIIEEVVTTANTNPGSSPNGTAIIIINEPIVDYEYSTNGIFWQDSNILDGLGALKRGNIVGGVFISAEPTDTVPYTAFVRKKTDSTCKATQAFVIQRNTVFLFASLELIRNTSTVGGVDGEVRVKVTSGSGNYTVKFNHEIEVYNLDSGQAYQSMIKVGLLANDYTITVTDIGNGEILNLTITVTDPQPVIILPGSFIEVPFMNSLHFVRQDLIVPQTPDNRLLINQYYPGFKKANYFQPVQIDDFLTTQINTDYQYNICELHGYESNKLIKTFAEPVVREKNIGATASYDIRIENHSEPGQSRVFFSVGPAPLPITIETNFEILNNANGFNGIYKPVDIAIDPNRGYEYIVIDKPWTPVDVIFVSGTGLFSMIVDNFDVLEFVHTFQDVPKGCYYLKIIGFDQFSMNTWTSEPIDLQVEHKKTNLIQARNIDNAFGLSFSSGYTIFIRIPSIFGHIRKPISERSTSRNSDWSLVKISGKKSRGFEFRTYMLPPYMHEKLNVLFDTDFYTINNVPYQSNEDYADPSYTDRVLLANSSIKLEQTNWFDKFNSDDIDTVAEGGFIQSNGGFIRR